jgi:hypothetical protein
MMKRVKNMEINLKKEETDLATIFQLAFTLYDLRDMIEFKVRLEECLKMLEKNKVAFENCFQPIHIIMSMINDKKIKDF